MLERLEWKFLTAGAAENWYWKTPLLVGTHFFTWQKSWSLLLPLAVTAKNLTHCTFSPLALFWLIRHCASTISNLMSTVPIGQASARLGKRVELLAWCKRVIHAAHSGRATEPLRGYVCYDSLDRSPQCLLSSVSFFKCILGPHTTADCHKWHRFCERCHLNQKKVCRVTYSSCGCAGAAICYHRHIIGEVLRVHRLVAMCGYVLYIACNCQHSCVLPAISTYWFLHTLPVLVPPLPPHHNTRSVCSSACY